MHKFTKGKMNTRGLLFQSHSPLIVTSQQLSVILEGRPLSSFAIPPLLRREQSTPALEMRGREKGGYASAE